MRAAHKIYISYWCTDLKFLEYYLKFYNYLFFVKKWPAFKLSQLLYYLTLGVSPFLSSLPHLAFMNIHLIWFWHKLVRITGFNCQLIYNIPITFVWPKLRWHESLHSLGIYALNWGHAYYLILQFSCILTQYSG